jgi:hypothetical protein
VSYSGTIWAHGLTGSTRLDLVEKFARKNSNARFVMAGADNTFLLPAIVDGGNAAEAVCQSLQSSN